MRARLFACLFLVPALALSVSFYIEAVFNQRLREPVLRMHPDAAASEIAKVSLKTLCAKKIPQLRGICSIYRNLERMRYAAAGFAALGVFALLGLYAARRAEKGRRKRMSEILALIRLPALGVYALGHFALAAAGMYYVYEAFLTTGGPYAIAAACFLALSGVVAMSLYLNGLMKKASQG